jgi:hypothetical protein
MKKLAVLLQIVGLLAICPMYVILEIRHSTNEKSQVTSGSFIKPKTEIKSGKVSTTQNH